MGNILKFFLREAYIMSKHSAAQKQDLPHLWLDKLRFEKRKELLEEKVEESLHQEKFEEN